jgi:hypothetical protein
LTHIFVFAYLGLLQLEDFSFDMTGQQALRILESNELEIFREKHGRNIPILVEGRVGIIESMDENGKGSSYAYVQKIQEAGATGAIVSGGLVGDKNEKSLLDYSRA